MVNKTLFPSLRGALTPAANTTNAEGASAYALSPRHQLAQLAATGCLSQTFYASAETELAEVLALAAEVDAEFVAKTAVYARQAGHMKDMPALLPATLATRDVALMAQTFGAVIDSGKMLRNWVQGWTWLVDFDSVEGLYQATLAQHVALYTPKFIRQPKSIRLERNY